MLSEFIDEPQSTIKNYKSLNNLQLPNYEMKAYEMNARFLYQNAQMQIALLTVIHILILINQPWIDKSSLKMTFMYLIIVSINNAVR